MILNRRTFLKTTAAVAASAPLIHAANPNFVENGDRPSKPQGVQVLNPRNRVPLSFIIDDSTCLVNLAHFCIPQFAEAFPDRYKQDWRKLPREIPDSFVRKFAEWCHSEGVKGKYSIVPYPACVGWVDREMPGWTRKQLEESLKVVREFILPDWDIHPEMVTHTWVINTKTGRPYEERSERFMENWRWTDGKSADELTNYLSYALQILKNAGLPCEGITTPGGFGNRVLGPLSKASLQSVKAIYNAEIPHYFRHLYTDNTSVAPRVENVSGLDTNNPECVVSIIGCTGDWFGGWDGLERGSVDQFITADLQGGRLPQVIEKGEPAVLVCHWPGIYYNGEEVGFNIFKEVVGRLKQKYKNTLWMKLSEISRYWAAKELTQLTLIGDKLSIIAPFACPNFTVQLSRNLTSPPILKAGAKQTQLNESRQLEPNSWSSNVLCFDLPKGKSEVQIIPS